MLNKGKVFTFKISPSKHPDTLHLDYSYHSYYSLYLRTDGWYTYTLGNTFKLLQGKFMNLQIYKFINSDGFFCFGVDNKKGNYIILVQESLRET